jgi:hypothetical protein
VLGSKQVKLVDTTTRPLGSTLLLLRILAAFEIESETLPAGWCSYHNLDCFIERHNRKVKTCIV